MKLGIYYHITLGKLDNVLSFPGFFGVFIDALAERVEELTLLAHTLEIKQEYRLKGSNIRLVDLGDPKSAWSRHVFPSNTLKPLNIVLKDIDVLVVRCPSPLAPYFRSFIPEKVSLYYYIVGSYLSSANAMKAKSLRDLVVRLFLKKSHIKLMKSIKGEEVIVNSLQLKDELKGHCKSIINIPSTTLNSSDIDEVKNTCQGDKINLIYTGRFDFQKGLNELFEAFRLLCDIDTRFVLNMVGWEDSLEGLVQSDLSSLAQDWGIDDRVIWHGKKSVGVDLWQMYRASDIYIMPSYHEGFPRTIWEAMAFSLPVIATSVGSIPRYLKSGHDCLLIRPKNVNDIFNAVMELVKNEDLRLKIVTNAKLLVEENTLSNRAKQLVDYVK